MEAFLESEYGIYARQTLLPDGTQGYQDDNKFYFITFVNKNEASYMEKAALAHYCYENKFYQVTCLIPNINDKWVSRYNGKDCMLWQVSPLQKNQVASHGERLAQFHLTGMSYPYEPSYISSYRQWKNLWINKLTAFENQITAKANQNPNEYHRLLMDSLPYIIGISENAIQYIQETISDIHFYNYEPGTITFKRYTGQLNFSFINSTDFSYDHPVRDIAEYIRFLLLNVDAPLTDIMLFLEDYQKVHPLSDSHWCLLFARLLYPVHLLDVIERGFAAHQFDTIYYELTGLLEKQPGYESNLAKLFENKVAFHETDQIPMLHWL